MYPINKPPNTPMSTTTTTTTSTTTTTTTQSSTTQTSMIVQDKAKLAPNLNAISQKREHNPKENEIPDHIATVIAILVSTIGLLTVIIFGLLFMFRKYVLSF